MKKIKTYNNFINESLKDKLKGKSEESIIKSVEGLSDEDALNKFCGYNYDPGIKYLIEKGLPYNNLITLIIRYCGNGNLDMIKYIVDKGNISIKNIDVDKAIFNPLTTAVDNGNFEIVKYLVENGIKINNWNNSPLASSISNGYYDIFKYLIDNGAELDGKGQDLIKYAINSGNLDIVRYLLNKGFKISDDKKYKLFNDAVLHTRNPELVKFMFDNFNIKIKNNQLLFDSIKYNEPFEIISLLHYYKPKHPNKQIHGSDRTPKYIKSMSIGDMSESAVLNNCLDCIKYLIEEKNGIKYLDDIVLNWSSYMGYYNIVEYLIDSDLIDSFWNINRSIELAKLNKQNKIIDLLNKYIK